MRGMEDVDEELKDAEKRHRWVSQKSQRCRYKRDVKEDVLMSCERDVEEEEIKQQQ